MLKKIFFSLFLCALVINAETIDISINDKYAACEKAFDMCIEKCEGSDSKYDECIQSCDENLYKCNSEVVEDLLEDKGKPSN